MKRTFFLLSFMTLAFCAPAQDKGAQTASGDRAFKGYLFNDEYDVYLRINLYDQDIEVPGQELYGRLPGFMSKRHNSFYWVITSATVDDERHAKIALINDYGSEDLTATLTRKNDSIYVLRQESGSALKMPKNGKWQKLPKTLEMKRKR